MDEGNKGVTEGATNVIFFFKEHKDSENNSSAPFILIIGIKITK